MCSKIIHYRQLSKIIQHQSILCAISQKNSIYQLFSQSPQWWCNQRAIPVSNGKSIVPLFLVQLFATQGGSLADHARIPTHLKLLTGCYARHCRLRNRPMRIRARDRSRAKSLLSSSWLCSSSRQLPFACSPVPAAIVTQSRRHVRLIARLHEKKRFPVLVIRYESNSPVSRGER